jgi:alpha-D-ribose 1-methylphosphonate 5-triphosphate synthase subunit PhnI
MYLNLSVKGENFNATILKTFEPEAVAKLLVLRGYRQVSRKFCMVARVDCREPELRRRLRAHQIDTGDRPITESDKDFYRRCISDDLYYDVPEEVMMHLRRHGGSP